MISSTVDSQTNRVSVLTGLYFTKYKTVGTDNPHANKFCVILLKLRLFWLNCLVTLSLLTDKKRHYRV